MKTGRLACCRYSVTVKSAAKTDPEGVIGYDPPLRSFFLQAFPDPETDACALWLGGFQDEYPTLQLLIETARELGFEVLGLDRETIVALTKEAATPKPPSIGERLGIVR